VAKASGELVDGGLRVVGSDKMSSLDRVVWLRRLDLGWGDTTAPWDFLGHAARRTGTALGLGILGLGGWNIEDVELAASGRLDNGLMSWVMGDVVAVHDIIVPVSLTLLHGAALEAEGACP